MSRKNLMARRRHELLRDVEESVQAMALELDIAAGLAEHLGCAAADVLMERWAGQQLTFPMNGYYGLSERELAIAQKYAQGMRVYELAREFQMTEAGMRKLLKRIGARRAVTDRRTEAQLDLFDPEQSGHPEG